MSDRYEYERIAAKIGEDISLGVYPPGSMLPSLRDLIARFEVSKVTMSKAIQVLSERGLVRAERGRGTTVLDPQGAHPVKIRITRHSADSTDESMDPWEAACTEQGRAGSVSTIAVGDGRADEDVAKKLQLGQDRRIIRRYRHARLDGRPAQLQAALYPADRFAGTPFADRHLLGTDTYAAMRKLGLMPASFSDSVTARTATPEEAADLRIRPGSPVLVIERITRDEQGTPLELLRIVADPLWTEMSYDELPLPRP